MSDNDSRTSSRRSVVIAAASAAVAVVSGAIAAKSLVSTSSLRVESFLSKGSGEPKNIVVLSGSARKGGNSDLLAEAFVAGARSAGHRVEVFPCGQKPMVSCLHCEGCWSNGKPCVVEDSYEELWPMLERAALLVVCSPLYWYNLSGHIKCALDRFYPYSKKNRPRDMGIREAMLLMSGESLLPRSFAGAFESWRQTLGFKGWKDRGRLFVTGVNDFGDIKGSGALAKANEMGRFA